MNPLSRLLHVLAVEAPMMERNAIAIVHFVHRRIVVEALSQFVRPSSRSSYDRHSSITY
jgi:hypothetical protein